MIAFFRMLSQTWAAKILFVLLVVAFGYWGVGDMITKVGTSTSVATVDGTSIEAPAVADAYRTQLNQVQRSLGNTDPSPELRKQVAQRALDQLITQAAMAAAVRHLNLAVPAEVLAKAVYAIPAFHGPGGNFDRRVFNNVLNTNNLTEQRFLALVRGDMAAQQLLGAAKAGVAAPDLMVRRDFAYQAETRVLDTVTLPFATAPEPPAPGPETLQRWYDNHPDSYATPEYRRVKLVILSPDLLAKDMQVSDDDLRAAYELRKSTYQTPEKRSAQVVQANDAAHAKALAELWRGGADWAAVQAEAQKDGGSGLELTDTTKADVPTPELGDAIFAAQEGVPSDPIETPLGWYVVKVTKLTPAGNSSFEQVRDALRLDVAKEKAADLVYDRTSKVEDALASGSTLDDMPGDLGLVGVTGTLDKDGLTPEGQPAPIPGTPALREAIIKAAFEAKKGDAPHLIDGPDHAYFALSVEDITPPATRPYDEVKDKVLADWKRDAARHEEDEAAAKLLSAVQSGQTLQHAADLAGLQVQRLPPVGRDGGQSAQAPLIAAAFNLKQGEPTMVETPTGFVVAVVAEIRPGNPDADPLLYGKARDNLTGSIGSDVENTLAEALRARARPTVNNAMLQQIYQPTTEE